MKATTHRTTLEYTQKMVSKKPKMKPREAQKTNSRKQPKKTKEVKTIMTDTAFLQTYVLRALECTTSLSTLGHIEGEFTPLLLAELKPAASMVRRRVWEKNRRKGY